MPRGLNNFYPDAISQGTPKNRYPIPPSSKCPRTNATHAYSSPSPNKHNPDFEALPSDENSLHSTDDPAACEAEELKMETLVAYDNAQLKLEAFEATEAEVPVQLWRTWLMCRMLQQT
jgi:hypothetical protein